jgi:hypothetical protein
MTVASPAARCAVLLGLASGLGACAAGDRVALPAPPLIERPTFTVGDRWVFTGARGRSEITYQGRRGEALVFRVVLQPPNAAPAQSEALYSKDLALVRQGRIENRPDDGELRFPLGVGRSWRHQFVRAVGERGAPAREEQVVVEAKVAAYERVRVPAGELDAFRIESTITYPTSWFKATYWYAPSVKAVIRHHAETPLGRTGLNIDRAELAEYEAAR